jgi:putative membrane protein
MAPLPSPKLALRCLLGGMLMGLANLVPGISGGTMLLASGVYRRFVQAIGAITTFHWTLNAFVTLAIIALGAGAAIALGAGLVTDLVVHNRWGTFSVFLGLTIGGIPLVWSLVRPWRATSAIAATVALLLMLALALAPGTSTEAAGSNMWLLGLAGLLGGAAMVLPGLSGAYLLLILGQYVVILSAVKAAASGDGVGEAVSILGPVAIGAAVGIVGVSNLMKWLLQRYPHGTHGFLLGLLAGAVFGLWPFAQYQSPEVGDVIRGTVVTEAWLEEDKNQKYWPLAYFQPSTGQLAGCVTFIFIGFAASMSIGRLGREDDHPTTQAS